MNTYVTPLLAALIAFFLGGIPSGLWIGRMAKGIDVRQHGSGNLGATNVYRTLGPGWGLTVLALDAAKGVAAVLVARLLAPEYPGLMGVVGMAGAFLGHMFTPFAGFRGGKGVATAAGSWAALVPLAVLSALLAWIALFASTRIVSIASIVAAVVLPLAVAILGHGSPSDPLLWLSVGTGVFVILRHRGNLRRIRRGEEGTLAVRGPRGGGSSGGAPREMQ